MEEKSIELEGARAQLRVIESKSITKSEYGSPEHMTSRSTMVLHPMTPSQTSLFRDVSQVISTPSMKAMIPLAMDDAALLHHSSSTESAQDNAELNRAQYPETPKRRPSKIPLAGQKTYVAPKPPSGKVIQQVKSSGPPSNRSLSKSTGSLTVKYSGPSSITKQSPSPNRSDSAQSWRKDVSLDKSHQRQSSIPVSAKGTISTNSTPTKLVANHTITSTASPVFVRTKRDSLTTRVKNLDSLSRMQSQSPSAHSTTTTTTSPNNHNNNPTSSNSVASNNNNNSNKSTISSISTKKDLSSTSNYTSNLSSSSVIHSNLRGGGGGSNISGGNTAERKRTDQPMVPVRRTSSATTARLSHTNLAGISTDNIGSDTSSTTTVNSTNSHDATKVRSGIRNSIWNWLKI